MRNLIIIISLILAAGNATAENYTIKMLNTKSININGKEMHKGDTFNEKAKINWSSDNQAMKVLSETNNLYVITPKLFKKTGVKSFSDFIATTKAATVRATDGFPVSVEDHKKLLSGDFILMDSISIKVGWKMDKSSYFIAKNKKNRVTLRIPHNDSSLIFTPEILGKAFENDSNLNLTVMYVEEAYNDATLITNDMNIVVVPMIDE